MVRKINWESRIGRRVKLRDLHVFVTIIQLGSMAKAAEQLGVSQSAVSEVVADLEYAIGVRLLDRSPRGIQANMYGRALLKRCMVVFDELRQGFGDIELLADPHVGEIRIGCSESIGAVILQPVLERFSKLYPRVVLHVYHAASPTLELPQLRERCLDVCIVRLRKLQSDQQADLNTETLFLDQTIIAAGTQSRWARRDKIDLAETIDEPWILTPPDSWNHVVLEEAFRARGLAMPKPRLITFSVPLRMGLAASDNFLTVLPSSVLRYSARQPLLKALPIELPRHPWPVAVVTLKNRTMSPVTERFIDHVRAFVSSGVSEPAHGRKSAVSGKARSPIRSLPLSR